MTGWVVRVGESAGSALVHEFTVDVIRRYFGRQDVAAEVERYEREEMDQNVPVFLVVSRDGVDAGCLGMRFLADGAGELTRMFVREQFRGQGAASVLIAAMEEEALRREITTIRLDTRNDLVEARALYAKHGYVEVERYNEAVYSTHWFEKKLAVAGLDVG